MNATSGGHRHEADTSQSTVADARVTAGDKQLFARAVEVVGMRLWGFVIVHGNAAAHEAIHWHKMMDLTDCDREVLVLALALLKQNPQPNTALRAPTTRTRHRV